MPYPYPIQHRQQAHSKLAGISVRLLHIQPSTPALEQVSSKAENGHSEQACSS